MLSILGLLNLQRPSNSAASECNPDDLTLIERGENGHSQTLTLSSRQPHLWLS
ncbi:MAG: hypothetical protein AAFX40_00220 [Cyanobacteria bacterium J06639_1]